jgi:hypothetical protein
MSNHNLPTNSRSVLRSVLLLAGLTASMFAIWNTGVPQHDRVLVLALPGASRTLLAELGAEAEFPTLARVLSGAVWVQIVPPAVAQSSGGVLSAGNAVVLIEDPTGQVVGSGNDGFFQFSEEVNYIGSSLGSRLTKREISQDKIVWPYRFAARALQAVTKELSIGEWSDAVQLVTDEDPPRRGEFRVRCMSESRFFMSPVVNAAAGGSSWRGPSYGSALSSGRASDSVPLAEYAEKRGTERREAFWAELRNDWFFALYVESNLELVSRMDAVAGAKEAALKELESELAAVLDQAAATTLVGFIVGDANADGGISEKGAWMVLSGPKNFDGDLSLPAPQVGAVLRYLAGGNPGADVPTMFSARYNPKSRRLPPLRSGEDTIQALGYERLANLSQPPKKEKLYDD